MKPNDAAIRKRTQIAKANRTMFIWIAVASALVGTAVVVCIFLGQKALYTERVLFEKQKTIGILEKNNEVIPQLKDDIRVLDTNQALMSVKANATDQAIQVILDAMPSEPNSLALGASLQNKLLSGVPGIASLESLQVDPIVGLESLTTDTTMIDASEVTAGNEITFRFVVKGTQDGIKKVLQNLERSIRIIDITSVRVETEQDGQLMTVQAKSYYEPAVTLQLTNKVVE